MFHEEFAWQRTFTVLLLKCNMIFNLRTHFVLEIEQKL